MADLREGFGGRRVPQQLREAVDAVCGGKGGGDVGRAVHAPADFDGAEYGGEGGAVVGEEVVHAFASHRFPARLGLLARHHFVRLAAAATGSPIRIRQCGG